MSKGLSNESTDANRQLEDSLKSCRICLISATEHPEQDEADFIAPCRCCGTLQFMHQACLLKWMNTLVLRNIKQGRNTPSVKCQICLQEYRAKIDIVWELTTCAKIKGIFKQNLLNKLLFIVPILLIIICFGALGVFIYLLEQERISNKSQEGQLIGFIIAIILVTLALLVWVFILLKTHIVKRVGYFTKVYDKSQELSKEEQNNPQHKRQNKGQKKSQNKGSSSYGLGPGHQTHHQ